MADNLLDSLLVPTLVPGSSITRVEGRRTQNTMAFAIASRHSSQELAFHTRDHAPDVMDLTLFPPLPPSQKLHNDGKMPPISSFGEGGGMELQDIADFDKEFPYKPIKLVPLRKNKPSMESASNFQLICDQRKIQNSITIEGTNNVGYTAKVIFGNQSAEITELWPSKKEAKEAVCKLAIAQLPPLEKTIGTKRKHSGGCIPGTADIDRSENWVGILNENAHNTKSFTPDYQEYRTEAHPFCYGCTVSILGGPLTPFGSDLGPFRSKSDAKFAAAKDAVIWLRAAGIIRQTPIKRQKQKSESPEDMLLSTEHTGLTQAFQAHNMETTSAEASQTLPQHVHELIAKLGFSQPRWHSTPSANVSGVPQNVTGGLVDMAVYFFEADVAKEKRLEGALSQVERVLGVKRAKIACCEKILPLLEEIQQGRMR